MNLKEMFEHEIAACSEFGGILTHIFDGKEENLQYIYFDEETEIVLEKDDYQGATTLVPMVVVQTSVAININKHSFLKIEKDTFGVIYTSKQSDGTTNIFLER